MRDESSGIVYFLQAPSVGLVKIGTVDRISMYRLRIRLQSIRGMSPVPLTLIGVASGDLLSERSWQAEWSLLHSHGETQSRLRVVLHQ